MNVKTARSRSRRFFLAALWVTVGLVLTAAGFAFVLTAKMTGPRMAVPEVIRIVPADPLGAPVGPDLRAPFLRVMTVNLAHGRKDGFSHLFQSRRRIRANLEELAGVVLREKPHVAAFQEVDGPSVWSGGLDHVAVVARKAGYPFAVRGGHVSGPLTSYGTALLAGTDLRDPVSVTFAPSPPTFSKGFVSARVKWPGATLEVTVVSVHLDFSRRRVRRAQVEELKGFLASCKPPLVIMGDFNCGWSDARSALRLLTAGLDLSAFRPEANGLATYPDFEKRLDWILTSRDLAFVSYRVLPDRLSDHLAVVADLRRRTGG